MVQNWASPPNELLNEYFFPSNKIIYEEQFLQNFSLKYPFMYDAAYYLEIQAITPWDEAADSIQPLLLEWNNIKETLHDLFQKRSKLVSEPMQKGIALFIQFLHWGNGIPVVLSPKLAFDNFEIKPVNVEERLAYILSRPNVYHSYMQLVELMNELEKQYKKSLAIKQMKNK